MSHTKKTVKKNSHWGGKIEIHSVYLVHYIVCVCVWKRGTCLSLTDDVSLFRFRVFKKGKSVSRYSLSIVGVGVYHVNSFRCDIILFFWRKGRVEFSLLSRTNKAGLSWRIFDPAWRAQQNMFHVKHVTTELLIMSFIFKICSMRLQ